MSDNRPTIYDVAKAASVSKSLVSLVLQGSPRVSEASRVAVNDAIQQLGYRPSRAAANLAAKSTKMVGVLIDDYTNLWFVDLLRGLHDALDSAGYRLSVADIATDSGAEDPIESFLSMRVDGIVVAMETPFGLQGSGIPPVVVAGTRESIPLGADSAADDDAGGAALAAKHLLTLGHRTLGHLSVGGGAGIAREQSFLKTAQQAETQVFSSGFSGPATEQIGYETALHLLSKHPEITAIFAANDVIAVGALGAAHKLGLRIPEDLSVVGYDNTSLAQTHLINLTTVDDGSVAVGREAGRLLEARMSGFQGPQVHKLLEPHLVIRGTTAPPRSIHRREK